MKFGFAIGVACAVVLHVIVILFGGIFFLDDKKDQGSLQKVDLFSELEAAAKEKEKPKETPPEEKREEVETDQEKPPDAAEILKELEVAPVDSAPSLDASSLSAIEAALNGQVGSSDFGSTVDLSSGGRIGGTGKRGSVQAEVDQAFGMADMAQKPTPISQPAPMFPATMRGKKIEGVVYLKFIVDETGKVTLPKVDTSTDPAFEQPALDAVKKWKYEPAIRAGKRVSWPMSQKITFKPT